MAIKFELLQHADVSADFLPDSDFRLLIDPAAPNHLANFDDDSGAFFYTPDSNVEGSFEEFRKSARDHGLSERFIEIMLEAASQNVPYVYFNVNGGMIDGLDLFKNKEEDQTNEPAE